MSISTQTTTDKFNKSEKNADFPLFLQRKVIRKINTHQSSKHCKENL